MPATITSTVNRVTINGNYKAFVGAAGSTNTVINYSSGDAPASGDSGRFLLWKPDATATKTWEIRYIESATATTVTVGDEGFSSAPAASDEFCISTNLDDVVAAAVGVTNVGRQYAFNGRDVALENEAFLGDLDRSIQWDIVPGSPSISVECDGLTAMQFGRITDANTGKKETIGGCHIVIDFTVLANRPVFRNFFSEDLQGAVINWYGCLVESFATDPITYWQFFRMVGPTRYIGCTFDGIIGGRFYNETCEWVECRISGQVNLTPVWSLGATFLRDIESVKFFQSISAVKTFQNYSGTLRDCEFSESLTDKIFANSNSSLSIVNFVDCTTFADSDIVDSSTDGFLNQLKSINYTVSDNSGNGLTGAKVAVYDINQDIQTGIQTSSGGLVDEILAEFYSWTQAVSTIKSPFEIRIRKYDYVYQDFSSLVAEQIMQEFRLPDNPVTLLSEAAAAALTGISIDFVSETITLTESRSLSEIYDYCQSQLALDANMDQQEFLKSTDGQTFTFNDNWELIIGVGGDITSAAGKTIFFGGTGDLALIDAGNNIDGLKIEGNILVSALISTMNNVQVTGFIDYSVIGTYELSSCTINEVTNSSAGVVTLNTTNGTVVSTNTGPNITIIEIVTVKNVNIIDDSRVQLYNVTKGAELDNSVVSGGGGYSISVNLADPSIDDGDTLRLRATYQSGLTAKEEFEEIGVVTIAGLTYIKVQEDDQSYITWGLDGSTLTGLFSADYVGDEVDIIVTGPWQVAQLGSWWTYNNTTEDGIREFFGGLSFLDEANIGVNIGVVDIFLDTTLVSGTAYQEDNRRFYRIGDENTRPVTDPTSGGGAVDVEWRSPVVIAASDQIQSDLTDIKNTVDTNLDVPVSTRSTQTSVDDIPTATENADAVWSKTI